MISIIQLFIHNSEYLEEICHICVKTLHSCTLLTLHFWLKAWKLFHSQVGNLDTYQCPTRIPSMSSIEKKTTYAELHMAIVPYENNHGTTSNIFFTRQYKETEELVYHCQYPLKGRVTAGSRSRSLSGEKFEKLVLRVATLLFFDS